MFKLTDKIALVTGASGDIGQAIVKFLHNQGAKVVISGTRQEKLQKLADQLGGRVTVMPCDLQNVARVEALLPQIEEQVGPVDILVNNAGMTRDTLMMRMKDEDWQQVIDVNLSACFRLSRAAIRSMMKKRFGRIINITSIVGVTGNPGQTNYAASKAGMIGLSKALASEVATRGITVNCVAPGFIQSAMTDKMTDRAKEHVLSTIPSGQMGRPEDIAAAVVYLASAEAHYTTGQTVHVNGGMAMI